MHRHRREPPAHALTPLQRIVDVATKGVLVMLLVWVIGRGLAAAGVLPPALAALTGPLLLAVAVIMVACSLLVIPRARHDTKPLLYARVSFMLSCVAMFVEFAGRLAGLWQGEVNAVAMLVAGGLIGTALLADAVRDAGRDRYPRLAVLSSAVGGTGMLMMVLSGLAPGAGDVLERLYLLGGGMVAAAVFGAVRLWHTHRSRADTPASVSPEDR